MWQSFNASSRVTHNWLIVRTFFRTFKRINPRLVSAEICGIFKRVFLMNIIGTWFTLNALKRNTLWHGHLSRYVNLRVAHAPGMPGTFSRLLRVSDPDMHHGMCVMHVPGCMQGSLTCGFLWSRWRGKRFQHTGACATHNFTYLVRGSYGKYFVLLPAVTMHL